MNRISIAFKNHSLGVQVFDAYGHDFKKNNVTGKA